MLDLQPILTGTHITLRPLAAQDFDALFAAASDPSVWAQHPDPGRGTREGFPPFFSSALKSKGCLVAIDAARKSVIGWSRYSNYAAGKSVSIGYTFLARSHWGGAANAEMKRLMLRHAFTDVQEVLFSVAERNTRSRRAVEKLGAELAGAEDAPRWGQIHVIYRLTPQLWARGAVPGYGPEPRGQSAKAGSISKSMLIRSAIPGDEIGVARVHVRAWQVGYQGLLSDAYLTGLRPEDRAKRYTFGKVSKSHPKTLVATEAGVIVGFATVFPAQDDNGTSPAELNALYVDPDCWQRGIGAALESAAGASLAQMGCRHAMLWVLAGNVRAIGFYESRGWESDGTSRQAEVWGVSVEEIRYVRSLDFSATGAPEGE